MSNRDYADLQELAIDYRRLAEETEMRAARLADALDAVICYVQRLCFSNESPSIAEAYRLRDAALEGIHASE